MADKTISELVAATAVGSTDLFVLEQSNTAKKLTGQILENWLVALADGHGGIQTIAKTSSTGTNPVVDTYTITLADETTYTFTVTNGLKGDTGAQTYVWIKWAHYEPTADNQLSDLPDDWIGIYVGLSSTAPTSYSAYTWYEYKGEKGDTGAAVSSVVWTSNSAGSPQGTAGTTDTYTMYVGTTGVGTFVCYNGNDGQGAPGSATPLVDSGSGVVGSASAYSREDHQHPFNVPSAGTPADLGTASLGTATTYAKSDHVHSTKVLNGNHPADTSTVSEMLAYAASNPKSVFSWAKDAAVTYTPINSSGKWTYLLMTGYDSQWNGNVFFEAQDCATGRIFRAKNDGTWVELQRAVGKGTVTLTAANWTGNNPYTQTVTVSGATVTSNSRVDIQPDATAIAQMISDGCAALYISNNAGTLTAYAVGGATSANLTVQVTVTEVL